jgi:hypothetical protein
MCRKANRVVGADEHYQQCGADDGTEHQVWDLWQRRQIPFVAEADR